MNWFKFGRQLALGLGSVLLVAACNAATPTPRPVVITVYGTGTPPPNALATPVPPTPTNGVVIAPTATPLPQATSIPRYGPDNFPANVNPLTGQMVEEAKIARMPIAIKISNFPYSVRPQAGLALADVVFEHSAEAGLTRFTAVYLQNDVAKVGSIRSARFIDTEIAPMFEALLVTSGSSLGTMGHLRGNAWFAGGNVWRLVSEESSYRCPPLCRETPDDANTLFANTTAVRDATTAQGSQQRPGNGTARFVFDATPPQGTPITSLLIDFSLAAHVDWRYDAATGLYTRWQEKDSTGEMALHVDALTNQAITAANVVILQAYHLNNNVPEDFRDGGNCGQEIQLWTIGPAKIFRNGQLVEGRWQRDATTNWKLELQTDAGVPIALNPGNTWFEVVGLNAIIAQNGATYKATHKVVDTKSNCPVPPTATPEGWIAPTETPEGWVAPLETETPMP